jgi:Plasmid pRiA4b ORF-3-like protein
MNAVKRTPAKNQWWWQLRIELLDVTPVVSRRVTVPEDITLPALHRVLQACMGWTNSHLHEFVIGGVRYAEPDPEAFAELQQIDERRVPLNKALSQSRAFDYVYDFGDDWHHIVIVEDPHAVHSSVPNPAVGLRCLAAENACPPEDVGGAHGYAEFLRALADPKHEEHANYMTWAGGAFDPTHVDLNAINQALDKIKL